MAEMSEIGISVIINDLPMLLKYDSNFSLDSNISLIVANHGLDIDRSYDLKYLPDHKKNPGVPEHYITEDSVKDDIKPGNWLKLVPSVNETVRELFRNMDDNLLLCLSGDEVFVQELIHTNHHKDLITYLVQNKFTTREGETGAMNVFYNIFQLGHKDQFNGPLTEKIVEICKANSPSTAFAIATAACILISDAECLNESKRIILQLLTVEDVMHYFKDYFNKDNDIGFYRNLLRLINSMVSNSKGDNRIAILQELSSPINRQLIYDYLRTARDIDKHTANGVFILQARLLTNSYIEFYTNRSSFSSLDSQRSSFVSDEEDLEEKKKWLVNLKKAESLFSIISETNSTMTPCSLQLVSMCLNYGRKYYNTYFASLEKSDYSSDAELNNIALNLITLLTKLLCIGNKTHSYSYFLPMYFAPTLVEAPYDREIKFLEELFVKTLFLFFRTKSEIRVKTRDDFKKLYQIVDKQLRIIFEKRPLSFTDWDIVVRDINYAKVQEKLKEERQEQWKYLYENNTCLRELANHFAQENQLVIEEQRLNVLRCGYMFPNMHTKKDKKMTHFFLQLRPNNLKFLYREYSNNVDVANSKYLIAVTDINHLIVDDACPLIKQKLVPESKKKCVFSIEHQMNGEKITLDCYIEDDQKTAGLWRDGINLLLGKDISEDNQDYQDDLNVLNEIDCAMQLIELQDIEIPLKPPPMPESSYKPVIPPKPQYLMERNSRLRMN